MSGAIHPGAQGALPEGTLPNSSLATRGYTTPSPTTVENTMTTAPKMESAWMKALRPGGRLAGMAGVEPRRPAEALMKRWTAETTLTFNVHWR